jgi:hypothetical protein
MQSVSAPAPDEQCRAAEAKLGCAELLKRLIEHHPELPIGICGEPGTKRPLINYRRDDIRPTAGGVASSDETNIACHTQAAAASRDWRERHTLADLQAEASQMSAAICADNQRCAAR